MKIIVSLIKKDIKRRIKSPFVIIIMLYTWRCNMKSTLHSILEELDSRLADSIDKLEEITPDLEKDEDAFTADDVRELAEQIRGVVNE